MPELLGIDNLKKLIEVGFSVPKQIAESSSDGWQYTDAFSFLDEAMDLIKLVKSWKEIVAEFKDLSPEERVVLHNHFATKFDIPNDQKEAWVEDALMHGIITVRMVERFKELKK